jgi:uncharacterized protein
MSREFLPELSTIFPNSNRTEIHLFTLLKKAYVDARYNDKYVITEDELTALIDKVKKLQDIAERVCKSKIASI